MALYAVKLAPLLLGHSSPPNNETCIRHESVGRDASSEPVPHPHLSAATPSTAPTQSKHACSNASPLGLPSP